MTPRQNAELARLDTVAAELLSEGMSARQAGVLAERLRAAFDAPDATDKLACLHLDHERPVHVTCARWAAALPRPTRRTHGFGMCVGGYQVGIR